MLEIKNIYKTFNAGTVNEKRALNGLSLNLEDGDFVTVIGGNGAGKSTMLNAVAGVWPVDDGRIILDGVFNHCGYWWDKFQDVVKNGKASPYRSWFFIHSYPVDAERQNYDCVGHYKWMPKLNLANPDARDYFLSVGRYWLEEFGIDGWRLDVADELPTAFLEAFAAAMRACS